MPDDPQPGLEVLERVRKLLIDPIVAEVKVELQSIRRELITHGERFETYLKLQHTDHEQRLRLIEANALPRWFWPGIALVVTAVGIYIAHGLH